MSVSFGIVGLPNVGKSTLFNALSAAGAASENYPFCTIEPNVGVVSVPDRRLDELARIAEPEQVIPTTVEFVDIAGLVRGASKGEGLGNQFLAQIRTTDAIVHVVRCFDDERVAHVLGGEGEGADTGGAGVDPIRDVDALETELLLKDVETVERRLERLRKQAQADTKLRPVLETVERLREWLLDNRPARTFPDGDTDDPRIRAHLDELHLLTEKRVLYAANVDEGSLPSGEGNPHVERLLQHARERDASVVVFCASIESEIAELPPEERSEFLEGVGLERPGLERLVLRSYELLDLITFFTAGPSEVRAWTIERGTKAPQAAGRIHSDFERGFIKAEVLDCETFVELGGESGARGAGKLALEGKDYVVRDGDVVHFRFNV